LKEIPLTKGKFAIVDDEDYELLSQFKWFASGGRYAARLNPKRRLEGEPDLILMHRLIINAPSNLDVDHINRDSFDNRKNNLRAVTHQENMLNYGSKKGVSKYKGVSKTKEGKWTASFMYKGESFYLGSYESEEDAAKAYNVKASELAEEFAYLNNVNHRGFEIKKRKKSSNYRGVTVKSNGKINASIEKDGKSYFLGVFDTEEDAARMYNFWAIDLFGNKAVLNKIKEMEETA
jgi:hypothetical protein